MRKLKRGIREIEMVRHDMTRGSETLSSILSSERETAWEERN